jgi:Family of unknown function (DUF6232)
MVTYYRGPQALVTDEVFEVWCPYFQTFKVRELYDVHVVRGNADPVVVGILHVAAGAVVVTLAVWPFLHSPTAWMTALAMMVAPSVVGGACWRLSPPAYELRATYRGYQVQLFRSWDMQTFGQVRRALVRSLERVDCL